MYDMVLSVQFWVAVLLAAMLKLRASPRLTFWASVVTVIVGFLSALVFTAPVLDVLQLDGDTYVPAVAALVALSTEHLARQVLDARLIDLLKIWRGGKE